MTTKIPTVAANPQSEPEKIRTVDAWRAKVIQDWKALKKQAVVANLSSAYDQLLFIALAPMHPSNKSDLKQLLKLIDKIPFCDALKPLLTEIYDLNDFNIDTKTLVSEHLLHDTISKEERVALDCLLVNTGALSGLKTRTETSKAFVSKLQSTLNDYETPSAVRVQAGMISAGQNLVFAGHDVNIVTTHYTGDKAALRAYLAQVRNEWNIPATNIHPRAGSQANFSLHELFTPPDVWIDTSEFAEMEWQQLTQRRFKAIDKDLNEARGTVFEAISTNPYVVITGGAGTGKSSICHYMATALAYACDGKAEKKDGVSGVSLLGPAWIHGALLPIYVSLRDFCNDTETFPKTVSKASASNLLRYIKKQTDSFAAHLEAFLTQTDVETQGTLLLLDGLDEIYDEDARIVLRQIIENWAKRFQQTRIILTSRTYAYRHDARWRLSEKFKSVELAPFTWRQMRRYIERWYEYAAESRPSTFGGRQIAAVQAQMMAKDLIKSILDNKSLWPLARQPLMLALLTLIHEDYKHLPSKKAELYEQTVELLDRWNIPSPIDKLHEKLARIDLERMRAALKHIAYDLQFQHKSYQHYPSTITRADLLEKLLQQQLNGDGLGAKIEDVLEYLATRNGILVSDTAGVYRFPHLSIQEYLAACALIEFYDECQMPEGMTPSSKEGWVFPENIAALLKHNPYRWRQVALFTGSIIAAGKGQDLRWQLIDELIPATIDDSIPDNELYSISVASEIWSESWLKARTRAQHGVRQHLKDCLQVIQNDERIDAPERMKNITVLARLQSEVL